MGDTFHFQPVGVEESEATEFKIQEELKQQLEELKLLQCEDDNELIEINQQQHFPSQQQHFPSQKQHFPSQQQHSQKQNSPSQPQKQQLQQQSTQLHNTASNSLQHPPTEPLQSTTKQSPLIQQRQRPTPPSYTVESTPPSHVHVQLIPSFKQQSVKKSKTKHSNKTNKPFQDPLIEDKIDLMKRKLNCKDLQIKNTLGTGTFGRVVLVHHPPSQLYLALKVLEISEVVRLKQVQHVKNEKHILLNLCNPFIVKMYWSDHTTSHLYMLMEYVCGGELFTYLRNAGYFSNDTALFYACEILLVLEYMHNHHLIYRDLKPENLLLDKQGHLKITDFGFAKKLDDRSWTLCGTPEYLAPEIIQNKGHNKAVDWWALGILIYEMLTGYPPFYDETPNGIYEKILEGSLDFPKHVDSSARDLIRKLLSKDRTRRLGNMKNGSADVKNHKWFHRLVWQDVLEKKLQPPIVPRVRHTGDTRNFFDYPEENCKNRHLVLPPADNNGGIITPDHLFDDF